MLTHFIVIKLQLRTKNTLSASPVNNNESVLTCSVFSPAVSIRIIHSCAHNVYITTLPVFSEALTFFLFFLSFFNPFVLSFPTSSFSCFSPLCNVSKETGTRESRGTTLSQSECSQVQLMARQARVWLTGNQWNWQPDAKRVSKVHKTGKWEQTGGIFFPRWQSQITLFIRSKSMTSNP